MRSPTTTRRFGARQSIWPPVAIGCGPQIQRALTNEGRLSFVTSARLTICVSSAETQIVGAGGCGFFGPPATGGPSIFNYRLQARADLPSGSLWWQLFALCAANRKSPARVPRGAYCAFKRAETSPKRTTKLTLVTNPTFNEPRRRELFPIVLKSSRFSFSFTSLKLIEHFFKTTQTLEIYSNDVTALLWLSVPVSRAEPAKASGTHNPQFCAQSATCQPIWRIIFGPLPAKHSNPAPIPRN